jgi:hypothetical protein
MRGRARAGREREVWPSAWVTVSESENESGIGGKGSRTTLWRKSMTMTPRSGGRRTMEMW